jgi:flavin-dependent dehydrogenase
VGAGPAGTALAADLALRGHSAAVFDASHPREKPCGGGLTAKALALLPATPAGDPLPARGFDRCRFESADGRAVDVPLRRRVAVASRRELDAWLLRRAVEAGAEHVPEHVVRVEPGRLVTARGRAFDADLVVGADGAGSLVRRSFLSPTPAGRRTMAAGFYARGDSDMLVRFLPGLRGYLWLFPRPDHVGVGICAPLGRPPSRALLERLRHEVRRSFPALADDEAPAYAHTIPSPSPDPGSIHEIAGPGWALVGDAAALADPVTGEGIYYALRSAGILAATLEETGATADYPRRVFEDFGRGLLKAARVHDRFYAPGFTDRMIRFASRSAVVREVLGDLVLGRQGYLDLKRRLLRAGPRFLVEAAWARLSGAA